MRKEGGKLATTPGALRASLRACAAGWAAAWSVYTRPQLITVLLLGFSSGLPLALAGDTLKVWLADRNVDLSTIGLLSLAGMPWSVKFLWAPVVDALPVPWLGSRLGRRRGWLIAAQLLLIGAVLLLATRDPRAAPLSVGLCALLVALASATQDIVVDAYRVEILAPEEQAAGMASYVAAYRIGMLVAGAGVIGLVAWLELLGFERTLAWPIGYALAAVLVGIGLIATLTADEPHNDANTARSTARGCRTDALQRVWLTGAGALREFLARKAAAWVLAFVLFYKLCDALAGSITAPFVLSLGYDKGTYAAVVKGLGLAALLAGGFAGGAVAAALPRAAALGTGAALQMLSMFAFVWLGAQPPTTAALSLAIAIEQFCAAIGTVILVAYISALCGNRRHTASQYALLTSLAAAGRTLFSAASGFIVDAIGWPAFFGVSAAAALPSLLLLVSLQRQGHFAEIDDRPPDASAKAQRTR